MSLNSALWKLVHRLPIPCRVIHTNGDPYLSRFYLWHRWRKYLPGVFLHHFHRGDQDPDLHSHPWKWSASLILTGGYREERQEGASDSIVVRFFGPGSFNFLRSDTYHRVDLLDPDNGCWTLFVVGPNIQSWGFLKRGTTRIIPWRQYVQAREVTVQDPDLGE